MASFTCACLLVNVFHLTNNTNIYMCSSFLRADIKVMSHAGVLEIFIKGDLCLVVSTYLILFLA